MRLVDKLRRISAPAPAPASAAPARAAGGPNAGPNAEPNAEPGPDLPGERIEAQDGVYRIHRIELPLTHVHGDRSLGAMAEARLGRLAGIARDPTLIGLDPRRCLYFDTETTSLGGGVGTWVFLLGAGWFEGDRFVVEQFFLEDVTGERALLEAVNARFRQFEHVVSFHGKGFDAPRLGGRLIFHRMQAALPPSHLDLCIVGRSLFRGAYANCRLQTFERELVRFQREDDLPGADCPVAFFDHLQGESGRIPRVFEHNFLDVLTLPAVAAQFADAIADPQDPVLQSNLGVYYESVGRDREARDHYTRALEGLRAGRHRLLPRTLERLALLERRAGRHAESACLLIERTRTHPDAFQPLEDLAKYYEHRARDLVSAEATVLDARSRLITGKIQLDTTARRRCLEALEHRLARLRRRQHHQPGTFQAEA
ncbi:MAG: ribonuclease H-like domain-containing protein [Planctomycetota bacterium]